VQCPNCGSDHLVCASCGAGQRQALVFAAPAPPNRRWLWWLAGAISLVLVSCTAFVVIASVSFNPTALVLSLAAACIPAALYSYLVLRLDRYEREPWQAVLAAFGWGAVAAVLLAIVLELLAGVLLLAAIGNPDAVGVLTIAIGAPLAEETTKGIALLGLLLFFRKEFDNVLDGIIYGALIGLGFAMTENVLYLGAEYVDGGARALGELFVARVVIDGFGHAVYTATTGAAVGWTRSRYGQGGWRYVVPVLGWSAAVLQHALWNGTLFIIGGFFGPDPSIIKVVLIQAPIYVFPAVIALVVVARLSGKRELAIMRSQLAPEVAIGVLTPREYEVVTSNDLRRAAVRTARQSGGRAGRKQQMRFFQVAAELAFRKHHNGQGELEQVAPRASEDAYRVELAYLRSRLASQG
jgi:protease PrsW